MATRSYSEATARQVLEMSGLGMPLKMMAQILDIPVTSIHRIYEKELLLGKSKASLQIAETLFGLATNVDGETPHAVRLQAAKYWANTQMGWSETAHITMEHQNVPVNVNFVTPQLKQLYGTKSGRSTQHGQTSEADDDTTVDLTEAETSANARGSPEQSEKAGARQIQPAFIRH